MHTQTSTDVVSSLLARHSEISELTIFEPNAPPPLQDRVGTRVDISVWIDAGLKIRREFGFPFWDSVLASCFGAGPAAVSVLEQAVFHNGPPRRSLNLLASDWSAGSVQDAIVGLAPGNMLVLSSRVRMRNGEFRHIPMLDFHVPPAVGNHELVFYIAKRVDPEGGYVLASGKSYHFYGKSLYGDGELPVFLGNALLFCPFIDRAWVAHQLIDQACGLRISIKPGSSGTPTLLTEL